MLCEICKTQEATVHLTQVIDGSIKKLHLCEMCAQQNGFDMQGPISITDILLGMGTKPEKAASAAATERSCPRCHMRRTDFKKSGRFGCSACYEAFADDLPPLLRAMHRNDRHIGKIPATEAVRVNAVKEMTSLQEQLEQAIAGENYETAAQIRDRITACRQKMGG
jgi:protein arginine kinase activator